jgi:hypothetical protein
MDTSLRMRLSRPAFIVWGVLLFLGVMVGTTSASGPAVYGPGSLHGETKLTSASGTDTPSCSLAGSAIASPNVRSGNVAFTAIDALSDSDVWAVGYFLTASGASQSFALHWDGVAWVDLPFPDLGNSNRLKGVSATSPVDAWAVGVMDSQPLTLHWDGNAWGVVPTGQVASGSLGNVKALTADDAWAVGSDASGPLLLHWAGGKWVRTPSPVNGSINSVDAVSSNDVWAVGNIGSNTTLILHWDGTQWTRVPSPNPSQGYGGAEHNVLVDVAAISAANVVAVGHTGIDDGFGNYSAMVLRWNGVQWYGPEEALSASPGPPTWAHSYLFAVSATGGDNIWYAGSSTDLYTHVTTPIMYRWNGSTTVGVQSDFVANDLSAVSQTSAWAVGSAGVLHSDGVQWSLVSTPPIGTEENYLSDIEIVSASDIWAVGHYTVRNTPGLVIDEALAMHWDGSRWSIIAVPSEVRVLAGVSALSSGEVWAVGTNIIEDPLTLRWDGTVWSVVPSPGEYGRVEHLNAVDAISTDDVWAVGEWHQPGLGPGLPLVLHWNGTGWSRVEIDVPEGPNVYLSSVSAVSASDVWAVGRNGPQSLTMHYDGAAWSVITAPNPDPARNVLRGVSARAEDDVWAVGYYGPLGTGQALIMHWDGSQWSQVSGANVGTDSFLFDVRALSANEAWAVGSYLSGGVSRPLVERWDGAVWSVVNSPNFSTGHASLHGIGALSSGQLWTIGDQDVGTDHRTLIQRYIAPSFTDVPYGSTFYPYVQCLACRNADTGYACGGTGEPCDGASNPYFRPDTLITRQEIAKMVAASAGFAEDPGQQWFQDVPATNPYYDWINRMAVRGLIGGYPCGTIPGEPCIEPYNRPYYRPSANATRGQIAKIVSNGAGFNEPHSEQTFEDVPPDNPFYIWVERLASRNVMGGYRCGGENEPCGPENRAYFRWGNNATRGQTAKITANTFFPECGLRLKP